MILPFEKNRMASAKHAIFLDRIKQIYAAMDDAYQRAAESYGFTCDGCGDNCCRTRFYHHTVIEYLYIVEGFATLTPGTQNEIKLRAVSVADETARALNNAAAVRLMCPLNFAELCILYPYRPMICRLHGIPHELHKPGQNPASGPGCKTFDHRCGQREYIKFDRTPFYRQLAMLEQEARQALGFAGRIRLTIAEMLLEAAKGIAQRAKG